VHQVAFWRGSCARKPLTRLTQNNLFMQASLTRLTQDTLFMHAHPKHSNQHRTHLRVVLCEHGRRVLQALLQPLAILVDLPVRQRRGRVSVVVGL
jgi:hypothetical protein